MSDFKRGDRNNHRGGRERTPERPRSSGIQAGESREKREQNNRHGQTASWVSWGKTTSGLKERSGLTRRGLASSHTYADVEWVTGLGSGRRPVPALKQEESVWASGLSHVKFNALMKLLPVNWNLDVDVALFVYSLFRRRNASHAWSEMRSLRSQFDETKKKCKV